MLQEGPVCHASHMCNVCNTRHADSVRIADGIGDVGVAEAAGPAPARAEPLETDSGRAAGILQGLERGYINATSSGPLADVMAPAMQTSQVLCTVTPTQISAIDRDAFLDIYKVN